MNLADLDASGRERILADAARRTVARGEFVYTPNDAADRVYFVISGRVKIVRTSANGADSIVGIRDAGEIFGELTPLVAGAVRQTSAAPIEQAEIASIAAARFERLLHDDATIARIFARGTARRLAEAALELTEISGKSVTGRLVDALGRLAQRHGEPQPDGTLRIGINLTHKDLADLIGTSRETLTKELGVLADVGLLRVAHKTVTLIQPGAFPFALRRE